MTSSIPPFSQRTLTGFDNPPDFWPSQINDAKRLEKYFAGSLSNKQHDSRCRFLCVSLSTCRDSTDPTLDSYLQPIQGISSKCLEKCLPCVSHKCRSCQNSLPFSTRLAFGYMRKIFISVGFAREHSSPRPSPMPSPRIGNSRFASILNQWSGQTPMKVQSDIALSITLFTWRRYGQVGSS